MIISMTGYGRSTFTLDGKNIVFEMKTLNSKSFDLNLRIAPLFKEYEIEIRNLLNKAIMRGKMDCTLGYELADDKGGEVNPTAVKEYYRQIKNIATELQVDDSRIFDLVFRLPNVTTTSTESLSEEQWLEVSKQIERAVNQLNKFRADEGANLKKDLVLRVQLMLEALIEVEALDPSRMEQQRTKMFADLQNYMGGEDIDKNRFEQELIFYLEKMDITEEVIRLRSHCNYFLETMNDSTNEKGKKLGFICQEMNREINTIGSKSYHAEMQRKVVVMKDELEKMKEQLNNVL
jgi:uncharacterized protein (TIGR00255 family)